MLNKFTLTDKAIGILGLGKTGISCFDYLLAHTTKIVCFDDNQRPRDEFAKCYGHSCLVDLDDARWKNLDYIVVSPGVSLYYPQKHRIYSLIGNAQIISDVEIFYAHRHNPAFQNINQTTNFIAVTGTNGKSTICSLAAHILQSLGYICGGNIGVPCLNLAQSSGYVLELSSFQLDLLTDFKPHVAAISNITPDHIDRYPSMQQYIDSKLSIACNMNKNDYLVVNIDDPILSSRLANLAHTNLITISSTSKADIYWHNNTIIDNLNNKKLEFVSSKSLPGKHNIYNVLIAYAICLKSGMKSQEIIDKITTFVSLKHRLEYLGSVKNIDFYNDSKATNAASARAAILSLENIFWLAGGISKEGGISDVLDLLPELRKAYFFGQSRFDFAKQAKDLVPVEICELMQEAFLQALNDAKCYNNKCSIVLSPACASFDQFKDFIDRGEQFTELVNKFIVQQL